MSTEQGSAGRQLIWRAYNKKTQDKIMLQYPDLAKYHEPGGYVLQKLDEESGAWVDHLGEDAPDAEATPSEG